MDAGTTGAVKEAFLRESEAPALPAVLLWRRGGERVCASHTACILHDTLQALMVMDDNRPLPLRLVYSDELGQLKGECLATQQATRSN